MNRRSFLATASAAAATSVAPALPLRAAAPAAGGFWANYLTALHGSVPAAQLATFSARPALPVVAAGVARLPMRHDWLNRAARRLSAQVIDPESSKDAP